MESLDTNFLIHILVECEEESNILYPINIKAVKVFKCKFNFILLPNPDNAVNSSKPSFYQKYKN